MGRVLFSAFLALLLSQQVGAVSPDPRFEAVFGSQIPSQRNTRLSSTQVTSLLSLAAARDWNIFDLLDEATLYLKTRQARVTISGADLRNETSRFDLGGRRVEVLLPLAQLISLSLGDALSTGSDIEILLTRPYSAFLELGDFSLATHYGFRRVGPMVLDDAFGIQLKSGLFSSALSKIARISDPTGRGDTHFVAISVQTFFQPKRWRINPIKAISSPNPKP